ALEPVLRLERRSTSRDPGSHPCGRRALCAAGGSHRARRSSSRGVPRSITTGKVPTSLTHARVAPSPPASVPPLALPAVVPYQRPEPPPMHAVAAYYRLSEE